MAAIIGFPLLVGVFIFTNKVRKIGFIKAVHDIDYSYPISPRTLRTHSSQLKMYRSHARSLSALEQAVVQASQKAKNKKATKAELQQAIAIILERLEDFEDNSLKTGSNKPSNIHILHGGKKAS